MAIDDPTGIVIRDAEEAVEASDRLVCQIMKLGISAAAAAALASSPFLAQMFTGLLSMRSSRCEERLLVVAKELDAQQKRIERRIADKSYYQSDEFQSLLCLVLERLQATSDEEKLRRFGVALANSGDAAFQADDREEYIRTLRELSRTDLEVLNQSVLKGWTPHLREVKYSADILCSLSRLAGMGLVFENFRIRTNVAYADVSPTPVRTYSLSPYGERFLKFVSCDSGTTPADGHSARATQPTRAT